MSRVLPILFNTEMVCAILEGRKTVTRRLVKPHSKNACGFYVTFRKSDNAFMGVYDYDENERMFENSQTPPYQTEDILYVRETWTLEEFYDNEVLIKFRAGGEKELKYEIEGDIYHKLLKFADDKWNPSLFMPKEAARIWLKVTDVRVERLQDITEEQTEAEGFEFTPPCLHQVDYESYCDLDGPCTSDIHYCDMSAGELFGKVLWNSTIKKSDLDRYGWDANPWVWVIEFERCEKPEQKDITGGWGDAIRQLTGQEDKHVK